MTSSLRLASRVPRSHKPSVAFFEHGGIKIGRIGQATLRLHWTLLAGPFVFTGLRYDPVAWACLLGLIVAHQLGHALMVKAAGASITQVEVTGYGGLCHFRGEASALGRAAIAWGGLLAQLALLAAAEGYLKLFGMPFSPLAFRVFSTLTDSNAWLIAVNLLPIAPLDGAEAWRLPILLGRVFKGPPADERLAIVSTGQAHERDEAFESGARRDEVKGIVSTLLEEARKE
jgi:Zn-dependent protease